MVEQFGVYKCGECGNVVQVLFVGGGELSCCGQPMKHLVAGESDGATEKHVPVVEVRPEGGIRVKVGSVAHPMEEKHYIAWIEVVTKDGRSIRRDLKPGEPAEAEFCAPLENVKAVYEYCNLHGLWKAAL